MFYNKYEYRKPCAWKGRCDLDTKEPFECVASQFEENYKM